MLTKGNSWIWLYFISAKPQGLWTSKIIIIISGTINKASHAARVSISSFDYSIVQALVLYIYSRLYYLYLYDMKWT